MPICSRSAIGAFLLATVLPIFAASVPVVSHGDSWRYHKGSSAPQSDWKTATDAGLSGSWLTGNGGFGYADNTPEKANCQTILSDMAGAYTTAFVRKEFTVDSAVPGDAHLFLRMDFDDGYIAWLDGVYIGSVNAPGAPAQPGNTTTASGSRESSTGNSSPQAATVSDLGLAEALIAPGTHTLAIMGLNQSSGSSDFILVPDLYYVVPPPPVTNVWALSNSPIVLNAGFSVANGETLVIEPGVTVELGAGADLSVANGGKLLAEGTTDAPIRFTRSGASGYWGNLTINGAVGSPESRIVNASFEFNANSTGTPCIQVSSGTVFLDHLTFANPAAPYIHVDDASFVISHCFFPPATASFEPVHGAGGIRSDGHGIFVRNFFGKSKGYSDVVDFTGGKRPGPIVHFFENVLMGSDDDGLDIDGTDAWVEGNIFLHFHKNAGTPDSSSGVSGGDDGGHVSTITVIGNLFYDCDEAADAKQGNFYTLINNTVVHQTHQGGVDTAGAVVILADEGTTQGAGIYLEGNVTHDIEQLTRNVTTALVTFTNNLLPVAWTGPGGGNTVGDPLLKHVPQLSDTYFTNWADAQILRDWFSLLPGSPAIGTGPNGLDQGGVVRHGASVSGAPQGSTAETSATLVVGPNRTGNGIPAPDWPEGSGYTAYKWRLDGGDWSGPVSINAALSLSSLTVGAHTVDVSGLLDSGYFQDDPLFGDVATTTSVSWEVVGLQPVIGPVSLTASNTIRFQFDAAADTGYVVRYRDSLGAGAWQPLMTLDPLPTPHPVVVEEATQAGTAARYYQIERK